MPAPDMHMFTNNSFIDLTIYQFGRHECPPFHSSGLAVRNHFLFYYICEGKGIVRCANENNQLVSYPVEAGEGFLIQAKQVASFIADEKQPWSYLWIEFDGLKAREKVMETGLTLSQPVYKGQNNAEQAKMVDALNYIVHNPGAPSFDLIGYCYLFLSNLAASSVLRKKTARSSLQNFYVNEILSYIESHYHENIRIEDIAAFCNLDRSHIGKIFKNVMGTNLRDFLIHYRITKACDLMRGTKHSIGEISGMAGYPNMFNFSRAFKSVMGISPRQWRDENKFR